jgi:hypothetical protein
MKRGKKYTLQVTTVRPERFLRKVEIMKLEKRLVIILATAWLMATLGACDSKSDVTGPDGDTGTGPQELDTGGTDVVLEDTTVLETKIFVFDVRDANWSEPKGAGKEFGVYVPDLMFQIQAVADDTLTLLTGTATEEGVQDECTATATLEASVVDNPYFETTPVDFLTYAYNENIPAPATRVATLYDLSIRGRFTDGGTKIDNGELLATLDFRELSDLFHLLLEEDRTPEGVCERTIDYDAECTACPSDGAPYCLQMRAQLIRTEEAVGAAFDEVPTPCYN